MGLRSITGTTACALASVIGFGLVGGASVALAADMAVKAPVYKAPALAIYDRCAKREPLRSTPVVPGGDIFGITAPTDIGDPCSWALGFEFTGRAGKRDGSYLAIGEKTQLTYTYSDRWAFALSPFIAYTKWNNVSVAQSAIQDSLGLTVTSVNRTQFDGISGEVFYRLIARSPNQPVAVTLSMEPRWSRVDGLTGYRVESYGNEYKLLIDAALTDRLFAAMNLNFAHARGRLDFPNQSWASGSGLTWSGALTAQAYAKEGAAIEGVYFGAEARYQAAYSEGLWLNRKVGDAVFLGPTMAIAFAGGRMLNFAWTPQLSGKATSPSAPGSLDLDNFERHQFRFKFATPL